MRTCVAKEGRFQVGIHHPRFTVKNQREGEYLAVLGKLDLMEPVYNQANFPDGDVHEPGADRIYEIHNPLGFRGTTFINSAWADRAAANPDQIRLPEIEQASFNDAMESWLKTQGTTAGLDDAKRRSLFEHLPHSVQVAVAGTSADPKDLKTLAVMACDLLFDDSGKMPVGMGFAVNNHGVPVAKVNDHALFEALVNNPVLPDDYKQAMVLTPGVQGTNEIVGEYGTPQSATHVFEYLRRNSYIPWGHYASNMANDRVRYRAADLTVPDMTGLRHLYYQRIFLRLAGQLGLAQHIPKKELTPDELEDLRQQILDALSREKGVSLEFNASLWGWNFGFQLAHTGYRLHASHQQCHQQNAMIPGLVETGLGQPMHSFSCGDLVDEFVRDYRRQTGVSFFENYINAIRENLRTDGNASGPKNLVVHEDEYSMLFVPKGQVCEWELQLMPKSPCGNILEAGTALRRSLDKGILKALQTLESLGARLVTSIEYAKRFNSDNTDQRLLYAFIPRLPQAPPTFSEAQFRWICGCYPEDFAQACRKVGASGYKKEVNHDSS